MHLGEGQIRISMNYKEVKRIIGWRESCFSKINKRSRRKYNYFLILMS